MNQLQNLFNYEGKEVRTTSQEGNVWFVAKDVCDVLDIANVSDAVSRLDDDEKLMSVLPIAGQNRNVTFISESGVYALTLTSRKPEAKAFGKWIRSEVLPQIRKTGSYQPQPIDTKVQLANAVLLAQQVIAEQTMLIECQSKKIEEDAPKVDLYDMTMDDTNLFNRAEVAKLLKMKVKDLTSFLAMTQMIYSDYSDTQVTPMHDMVMGKCLETKFPKYLDNNGELQTGKSVLYFTTKGIDTFMRKIKRLCYNPKHRPNILRTYPEYVEMFAPERGNK